MLVLAILLFIALSPGLFLRIPTKGSLLTAVLVHATVFGVVLYLAQKVLSYEGFNDGPVSMQGGQQGGLMTVTLSSADISPIVAKVQLPSSDGKTYKMALPTMINTTNPVSATVDGNVMGKITFPEGIHMPSGEYTVVMGPS
jgi:hypothetical protein